MTAFLLDMDGVLYHGDHLLPGAPEFVSLVAHFPHLFVTNNSALPPAAVAERLSRMGFGAIDADRILTSADATALWLERTMPGFRYFAVGGVGLHEALEKLGTADEQQADFVVIGEGPGLDYDTLTTGINLVRSGAHLVATNPDASVDAWRDGKHLVLPGGGALAAPFEAATGMKTALVRTGRFRPGSPWPQGIPKADWDVDSLPELIEALRTSGVFSLPDYPGS